MRKDTTMPMVFVGHGSPMNAIESNEFTDNWQDIGKKLTDPKAILSISAHWETEGTRVTCSPKPKTIYDFDGFPEELYEVKYPAPGSPELAKQITKLFPPKTIELDSDWGLDHGTWSVLSRIYPKADIPVVQLSLDYMKTTQEHFDLAKSLSLLRNEGILILGSGNMVHNLGVIDWKDNSYEWAIDFNKQLKKLIVKRDFPKLINYKKLKNSELAIPTREHYLPLLYILAMTTESDKIAFFNEKISLGSISMSSLYISAT